MKPIQTYREQELCAEVRETAESIEAHWSGRSELRNPRTFMIPILLETLSEGARSQKRVTWNFKDMDYMNSSSVTPIIKALERARRERQEVHVIYRKSKKWQDLSFSALRVFATRDGRIQVSGLE